MQYSIIYIIFIMRRRVTVNYFRAAWKNFLFDGHSCISDTQTFYELVGIRKVGLIGLSERNSFNDSDLKFILFVPKTDQPFFRFTLKYRKIDIGYRNSYILISDS